MMFSKYHRNAIITGYIDSYCLVCESHLRSEDDINGHIAKPIHTKNLDATTYLEKYKDEGVRKVKKGYFCEFCNALLSTAAKVGLHVIEEKHISNKKNQLLRRIGNNITFQNIMISEKAWNGLIDDTCAICNTEFENELLHKTETAHILNLVQNKVEFGADNSIYRMIDDSSFQCLTCNMVLGINTIKTHFDQDDHMKAYLECEERNQVHQAAESINLDKQKEQRPKTTTQVTEKQDPIKTEVIKTAALDLKQPLLDSKPKQPEIKEKPKHDVHVTKQDVPVKKQDVPVKKQDVPVKKQDVPVKKQDAPVKKPDAPVKKQDAPEKKPIPTSEVIKKTETPIEPNTSERPKFEAGTVDLDEQICKALNAKDYITHDENGKKWCLLCDWTMDSVVIYNHVNGRHHQTMLKLHKERLQNKKKSQESTENKTAKVEKVQKEELSPKEREEQENKSKILDSVTHFQNNNINIYFESKTVMCKKCSTVIVFDCKAIEAHIEEHKKEAAKPTNQKVEDVKKTVDSKTTKKNEDKKTQQQKSEDKKTPKRSEEERTDSRASSVTSYKETEEEIEKFAKANDLAYNRRDSKVYCRVCDTRIPASTKNMKEHIQGQHHKNKMAKFSIVNNMKVPSTIKKPMNVFIKNLAAIENSVVRDVIINERYCINIFSFLMITCVDRFKCEPCDVNLSVAQLDDHKGSISHLKAMCETEIVVSMESEFIREVRPDTFHCGYCNIVSSGEDLQQHLGSTTHREAQASSGWRLHQGLAELIQHQDRQRCDMLNLLRKMKENLLW